MQTQMQTKTKHHTRHTSRNPRVVFMAIIAMLLPLASCINDNYDEEPTALSGKTVSMEMSIQTRSISDITSTSKTYVEGTEWENYINFAGGDYRIYFFTYNPTEETAGKGLNSALIAEFKPTDIYATDQDTYTTYTMSGEVNEALVPDLKNFKVVVIANWGVNNYPNVSPGTTIDDLCNAQTAVFNAFVDANGKAVMPSADHLIPFFGLCEYSGVTWTPDVQTKLSDPITMLRAVAKVEVVFDNSGTTFDDVSIVNYNSQGYCAPTGVYLQSDYDHNGVWASDFVNGLHLVNDKNDSDSKTISLLKTQDRGTDANGNTLYETWVCYLPEYDNMGTDYCYISVTLNDYPAGSEDEPYKPQDKIYFANYGSDGTTDAYTGGSTDDRYDVYRNYLYRFTVSLNGTFLRVIVNKWEDTWDNEFDFDETIYN